MAINSKVPIHAVIFLMFFFLLPCFASGAQGRLEALYAQGAKTYDVNIFEGILQELDGIDYEGDINLMLLRGKSLYWIELIYYVSQDKKNIKKYGYMADKELSAVLSLEPGSIEAMGYRALVYQHLTPTGITNAIKYGTRAKQQVEEMAKLNPKHYLARLVRAINYLRAPVFVGGNRKRALDHFLLLVEEYPGIEDLKVYLAEAYYELKDGEKSLEILKEVLGENSDNLFARLLSREIIKRR